MPGPIFRLFVSSTFIDMRLERDLLQAHVFPNMKRLAASHGGDLRVVDLRWGIPESAARLHTVPDMCLQEVEEALHTQIEPRFLCLVGNRYGWRPLPPWLLNEHLRAALDLAAQSNPLLDRAALDLLREWYVLDENSEPSRFVLKKSEVGDWNEIEPKLRAAIDRLGSSDEWLAQHAQSLTEREARRALESGAKAFALVRTLLDLHTTATGDRGRLSDEDEGLVARQSGFRDYVMSAVPDSRRIDLSLTAAAAIRAVEDESYMRRFTEAVEAWMSAEIRSALRAHEFAERARSETQRQRKTADAASRQFLVRSVELADLVERIKTPRGVVIVHGAAGSGKTTLVSRAWCEADDGKRTIIARFLQSTDGASPRQIMDSLLQELQALAEDRTEQPPIESAAIALFHKTLSELTQQVDVTLLFDGVDEVPGLAESLVRWVSGLQAQRLGVVISARDGPCAEILRNDLPGAHRLTLRPLTKADGGQLLDLWLTTANRRLQPAQRESILSAFATCASPLWLRVAFELARKWTSTTLPAVLPGSVEQILRHDLLTSALDPVEHVPAFAIRAISLIAAARHGLTENELIDCICGDKTFWAEFNANTSWDMPEERVPDAVWGRLKVRLEPYLTDARSGSTGLLRFRHSAFVDAVRDAWQGRMPNPHAMLRDYFGATPLFRVTEAGQRTPDPRKLIELPFHLSACKQTEDLVALIAGDESWRLAWLELEGNDRAFQADIDLALNALSPAPDGTQIKLAAHLMRARWTSDPLRTDPTEYDLRLLVWAGQEQRAIDIATSQDDPELAAVSLAAVVEAISARLPTVDLKLLARAEKAACALANPWPALRAFELLGCTFARLSDESAFERVLNRLAEMSPKYNGDAEGKARFVARAGEEAAKQGHFDLARRTIDRLSWGMLFDGQVAVRCAIARELAARGRLDEAVETAALAPASEFDYGMVWVSVLRGARRHGTDTLRDAAMQFDPEKTRLELVYECAREVAEDAVALSHVLRPLLEAARSIVPELAALTVVEDSVPKKELYFPTFEPPAPPTPAQERARELWSRATTARLDLLCDHAVRLGEPFADDLLRLAPRIDSRRNTDEGAMSFGVRAAAYAQRGRAAESASELLAGAGCALGATRNVGRRDELTRLGALRSMIVCASPSIAQFRALVFALPALDDRFRVALGVILARHYLPVAMTDFAFAEIERQLDFVDSLTLLHICGEIVCGTAETTLVQAVLSRVETCLREVAAGESATASPIHVLSLEGWALLDPRTALLRAIAGNHGNAEDAVLKLAILLSARASRPAERSALISATQWLCDHCNNESGFGPIVRALLAIGQLDLAMRYIERLLDIKYAIHRVIAGLIVEFARAGEIERLLAGLRRIAVEFTQDLHWLLGAALQPADRWPSTTLSAEQLEALGHAAYRRDLLETALAARQLGMPAGKQLVDHLRGIAERESTNDFGYDLRNPELKSLCFDLCAAGALSEATQVLARISKSGGDGENHVDWSTAVGVLGAARCRQGDIEGGRALTTELDVFDADERSAVDTIRIAAATAYLDRGALHLAEREISLIPTLHSRRRAQGILAIHHCANGRLQEGLRLIQHAKIHERMRCFMECVKGMIAAEVSIETGEFQDIVNIWCER